LTKVPANLLSLGAIDFGIIVDGAVVMAEAILRRREAKPTEPLTEADVREAATQVAGPIFFSTLIIITAYMPLFALERVEAKFFSPMISAVGFAQFGALLMALLLVPGLAYRAYRKPRRVFHNPVLEWLGVRYRWALQRSLGRPRIVYVLTAAAAVAVVLLAVNIEREFLPDLDEGAIRIHLTISPGRPASRLQKRRKWPAISARWCTNFRKSTMSSPSSAATTRASTPGPHRTSRAMFH